MTLRNPASLGLAAVLLTAGFSHPVRSVAAPPNLQGLVVYSRGEGATATTWIARGDGAWDIPVAPGSAPRLSPDGRVLLVRRGESPSSAGPLFRRDLVTGVETEIAISSSTLGYAWRGDGLTWVYDESCQVMVRNADGSSPVTLFNGNCTEKAPDVHPADGRLVYYDTAARALGVAAADGTHRQLIPGSATIPLTGTTVFPGWSPDGTWIAFTDQTRVFKIRPDGTGRTELTAGLPSLPLLATGPTSWSLDGQWVLAALELNGTAGVYAVPANGQGSVERLALRPGEAAPQWVDRVAPAVALDLANLAATRLSVVAPAFARIGDPVSVQFQVRNFGPLPTSNLVLTGALPASITQPTLQTSSGTAGLDTAAGTFQVSVGAVPVGGSVTVTLSGVPNTAERVTFIAGTRQSNPDNWLPHEVRSRLQVVDGFRGELAGPGETDLYQFSVSGTQIENWYFDSLIGQAGLFWSLSDATGELWDRSFSNSDGASIGDGQVVLRLAPGDYDLRVQANPGSGSPYAFNLKPLNTGELLVPGAHLAGELSPGNATRIFQFPAQSGDRVQLQLSQTNLPGLIARLVDPFGQVLMTTYAGGGTPGTSATIPLLAEGNHSVLVEGPVSQVEPGSFGLRVLSLTPEPPFQPGQALTLGVPYRTTETGPFTNVFRFAFATASQMAFTPTVPNPAVRFDLTGPAGRLAEARLDGDGWFVWPAPAGDYQLRVWSTAAGSQALGFTVRDLAFARSVVADGSVLRGTNNPASDDDFVRVPLTAGTRIYSRALATSGSDHGTSWRWYDPFGRPLIASGTAVVEGGFNDLGAFRAPYTGTYLLGLGSYVYETRPSITREFSLTTVTDIGFALEPGTEYAGQITQPGQVHRYRFSVAPRTAVSFDLRQSSSARWQLVGPRGEVAGGRMTSDSWLVRELDGGEHELRLSGDGPDLPAYRFALLPLAAATPVSAHGTNTLTFPAATTRMVRFNLTAGERFYTRAVSQTGFPVAGSVYWTLLDPFLQPVWDTVFADRAVTTIPRSGIYTLLLGGYIQESLAPGTLTYALMPVTDTQEALELDTPVTGAIQQPGQQRTYHFDLTQPTRISVDTLGTAPVRFVLAGPGGEVVNDSLSSDRWWWYDLPAGRHSLTLSATGSETPGYHFQVATAGAAANVTPGVLQTVSVGQARANRFVRVPLQAGQRISVGVGAMTGYSVNYRLPWIFLSPSGTPLTFNGLGVTIAPVTGTYDLLLGGSLDQPEAPATAEVQVLPVPIVSGPITLGQPVSGQVGLPGELDRFTFTLGQATRISVDSLVASDRRFTLTGPEGEVVNDGWGSDRWWTYRLPAGGYTLDVFANQPTPGPYGFRIVDLEVGTPLPLGVAQTAALNPGSQTVSYPLDLAAGQTVFFQPGARNGFSQNPAWTLVNPSGQRVWEADISQAQRFTAVLPGRYALLIGGNLAQAGLNGTVQFTVTDEGIVPPVPFNGTPLAFNTVLTGTLAGLDRQPIPGLFNTGVDEAGQPLPVGAADPHYTVLASAEPISPPAPAPAQVIQPHPSWLPLDATSGWLGPVSPGTTSVAAGTYRYQTRFHLDGLDPRTAELRIGAAIDDRLLDIRLNGRSTGLDKVGYSSFAPELVVTDGFQAGENVLEFVWANDGTSPNPGGFRARVSGTAGLPGATPEVAHYTFSTPTPLVLHLDVLNPAPFFIRLRNREGTVVANQALAGSDEPGNGLGLPVLPPGEYQLSVSGAPGTYAFRVLDWTTAPLVAFDTDLVLTNQPAVRSGLFRFQGEAGQRIAWLGAPPTGYSSRPGYWLAAPSGRRAGSGIVEGFSEYTLPETGLYRGFVGSAATETSNEGVIRFRLASRLVDTLQPLVLEQIYEGQIPGPGAEAVYSFTLATPQRLTLDVLSGNTGVTVSLENPEKAFFINRQLWSADQYENAANNVLRLPPGNYTLRFAGPGAQTPTFRFALRNLDRAQPIAFNTLVTGTNQPANQSAFYRFNVNPGDGFLFHGRGYSGYSGPAYGEVYYPISGGYETPRLDQVATRIVFPEAGVHELAISGYPEDTGTLGTHSFHLWKVADETQTLTLGLTYEGRSSHPQQRHTFRWSVATPTWLLLDDLGSDNVQAELTTPVRLVLNTNLRNLENNQSSQLLWAPAGEFELTLQGSGAETNRFRFRVLDAAQATPIPLGTVIRHAFPEPGSRIFRFTAQAGDRLYLKLEGSTGFPTWPDGRLFGPDGQFLLDLSFRTERTAFTVPLTGNYFCVVNPPDPLPGAAASLSFGFFQVAPDSAIPLFETVTAPDLAVDTLSVSPGQPLSGSLVTLRWITRNAGAGPVTNAFSDRVLVRNGSGQVLGEQTVGGPPSTLVTGASVNREATLRLPDGPIATGTLEAVVTADAFNLVAEGNAADTGEANNGARIAFPATLAPYPDLLPLAFAATPPGGWTPGLPVTLTWITTNAGPGIAIGPWVESLILSNAQRRVVLATLTTDFPATGLAPGGAVARSLTVTLPATTDVYGTLTLFLRTDAAGQVAEFNAADTAEANNLALLTVTGAADLAVAAVFAPTALTPGEPFELVHVLTNRGTVSLSGNWQDSFFLTPGSGTGPETYLGQVSVAGALAPGDSTRLTNRFVIPRTGVAGPHRFKVRTDAGLVISESDEDNNETSSGDPTAIPQVLTLQLSTSSVEEANPRPVSASVSRNGDFSQPLTVTLVPNLPGRFGIPSTVLIPANSASVSFDLQPARDGLFTGPQQLRLTASAPGFAAAEDTLTIVDSDLTRLGVALASGALTEGGTVGGTVTRTPATDTPLTVQLLASDNTQVILPGSLTIPAGATSAPFTVNAVDDDLIERTNLITLTASVPGLVSAAVQVAVVDNDIPIVTLALAQRTVSEGAGAQATSATLTRSPVTAREVVVLLDSAQPAVVRLPASAVIPANQASTTFPVAVIDNTQVEAPRPVSLGGTVLDSARRSPVAEITPDLLTITDDDGPTLTLLVGAEAVAEGRNPATSGTVLRNTSRTLPLVVQLGSSRISEATVPATVTIPADSDRASFPIVSLADGIPDGNQTVVLTASAAGLVTGTATLIVTDSDRPDLVVASLTFPASGIAGESVPVTLRVENRGAGPVSGSILQRLQLSTDAFVGGDVLLGQIAYPGPLPAGSAFEQTLNARLPDQPGDYHFVAETDVAGVIPELLEGNNLRVSPTPIEVRPAYTATVGTDVTTGVAGSEVPLQGQARRPDGTVAANSAVTLHIALSGTRRTLAVITGPDGRFNAVFQPLPTEGGLYQIAASHPGLPMPAAQDEFRLLGMAVTPLPGLTLAEGATTNVTIRIDNRTDVPLTGLTAEVVDLHPSLQAVASLSQPTLPGDGSVSLLVALDTVDTSAVASNVRIRIRSAEGVEAFFITRVRQEIRVARLVATPSSIQLAMVRGRQTPVAFTVRNEGGLETGPLRVLVPSTPWLALSSPADLPSLAPGESTPVTLLLTPSADLPLGDYTGAVVMNSEQSSLSIPTSFRAISDGIGDLAVVAEDEFTYFAEGSPRLANALVVLSDALSGAPIRTNRTGVDGRVVFTNLTEAYYLVAATAEDHRPFVQSALVIAGATTNVTAFLSRDTVRYTFFVEPTTVEDRYTLRVESQFETQIPVPIVTIEPAAIDIAQYPGTEFQVNVTVRNHGLIAADSVRLSIPNSRAFTVTPLVEDLGRLPAGASVTVPVVIRRIPPTAASRTTRPAQPAVDPFEPHYDDLLDDETCSVRAAALWDFRCGPNLIGRTSPWTIFDSLGCDEAELFQRVFRYEEIPYWTQPGSDPAVAAFINQLPTIPFNYAAMTTFRRVCRPAPLTGPLPNNPNSVGRPRSAAPAAAETEPPDVCARVSLQLSQSAVLARDAFRATLEIENDSATPLEGLLVHLEVRRPNGSAVTEQFVIRDPELEVFTGVDGSGQLPANATGRSRWILLPTLDAAPTNGPALYLVSGTLSYRQAGTNLTIPLASAPITVYPQPELVVRYFHERNVFADDPFTPEIEPSIPYSLAVQVLNVGHGDARGLRLSGGRPQVIDNSKGLQIEFRTLATQLENQPLNPVLDVDFGAIPAGTNRLARWVFSSSLQGSFTNFAASFEHTDALGGRRLSLLRSVEIHELSRLVAAGPPAQDQRPDLLVNDTADPQQLPDRLYLSDGTTAPVVARLDAALLPTGTPGEFQLSIPAGQDWTYLRLTAPEGSGHLVGITRPDGTAVPPQNFWSTDRFFLGGGLRPIRTNWVHLLDHAPGGNYRVTFQEPVTVVADLDPPVSQVQPFASEVATDFPVTWSGTDAGGSGIERFDLFVAVDAGPFLPWLERTSGTAALFRGEPGRTYAFYSVATDAAGNREPAPTTADATARTTLEGNRAPAFGTPLTVTVSEEARLEFLLPASDPDPGQSLTFTLVGGAPTGLVLDPGTGRCLWIPGESDGPSIRQVQVRVTDNGSPVRSTDATLVIQVTEANQPPRLVAPADTVVTRGSLLAATFIASDPDLPEQRLRFELVSGPAGAQMQANTGVLTWRPRPDQGGRAHAVTVRVSDDAVPSRSDEATFHVGVRDSASDLLLLAGRTVVENGSPGLLPFSINAPADLQELNFQLALPADRIASLAIRSLAPDVAGATLVSPSAGSSELRLQLRPGSSLLTTRPLLELGFDTASEGESRIVVVTPEITRAQTDSGTAPAGQRARSGRIVLVGLEAVLSLEDESSGESATGNLTVFGPTGLSYFLEGQLELDPAGTWETRAEGIIPDGQLSQSWQLPIRDGQELFRANPR